MQALHTCGHIEQNQGHHTIHTVNMDPTMWTNNKEQSIDKANNASHKKNEQVKASFLLWLWGHDIHYTRSLHNRDGIFDILPKCLKEFDKKLERFASLPWKDQWQIIRKKIK